MGARFSRLAVRHPGSLLDVAVSMHASAACAAASVGMLVAFRVVLFPPRHRRAGVAERMAAPVAI